MTFNSLPTDNLYKFFALFGLVVALASFGLLEMRSHQLSVLTTKIDAEFSRLEYKATRNEDWTIAWRKYWKDLTGETWDGDWYTALDRITELVNKLKADINSDEERSSEKLEFERKLRKVVSHWADAPDRPDIEENIKALTSHGGLMDVEKDRLIFLKWILIPIGLFGIVISITGFILWYFLFQKYQDQIVRLQAERAQKDMLPRTET